MRAPTFLSKPSKPDNAQSKQENWLQQQKDSDEESSEKRSGLFHCPEEGCVKSFQQYSSLEKHLDCDTHKYALEHETLYDKARVMYAAKLEHGAGVVPETVDGDLIISLEDEGPALRWGGL